MIDVVVCIDDQSDRNVLQPRRQTTLHRVTGVDLDDAEGQVLGFSCESDCDSLEELSSTGRNFGDDMVFRTGSRDRTLQEREAAMVVGWK